MNTVTALTRIPLLKIMFADRLCLQIVAVALAAISLCGVANAGRAPTSYYVVSNDSVGEDRFSSPEDAARASIARMNTHYNPSITYNIYDHLSAPTVISGIGGWTYTVWTVYYLQYHYLNGITGPYQYGSAVFRYYTCDPTPLYEAGGQPRAKSEYDQQYASGCVSPSVDKSKNMGAPSCPVGAINLVGNPINVGIANKYQREVDYTGSGAFPLEFVRHYNSLGGGDTAYTPFRLIGERWRNNYERSIKQFSLGSNTSAAVARPDGNAYWFNLSSGTWVPDADISATLVRLVDGGGNTTGWTYTAPDDSVESYDAVGKLTTITHRSGLTQTLTYSDAYTSSSIAPVPGLLIQVSDDFGRQLNFTYDSSGRMISMTVLGGGTYAYVWACQIFCV